MLLVSDVVAVASCTVSSVEPAHSESAGFVASHGGFSYRHICRRRCVETATQCEVKLDAVGALRRTELDKNRFGRDLFQL